MTRTDSTARLTLPFLPVAAALFCIQLDFFSLNLALPTIAEDLATPVTDLQWLLSGYMIALGALLIPAGRAGDVLGRRRVLLTGVAVFGLTSLVCGLVSSVPVLIAARVAQGVGAALIFPTAFALVTNATGEQERPRVIGALLGIAGAGTALGPVAGGVLASTAGWRWVFLLNVPIVVLALWGGRRLTESRDASGPRTLAGLDRWGVLTIVGGLALLSLAIDDVSAQGLLSAATLVPLIGGIGLLVCFAVVESRAPAPLVRPSLLRNRLFVVLLVAGTLANVGSCVYILVATLDLQTIRGLSPVQAGTAFFVSSVGLALCGPLSARLSVRYPAGVVMGVAVLLSAPALALLALAGPAALRAGAGPVRHHHRDGVRARAACRAERAATGAVRGGHRCDADRADLRRRDRGGVRHRGGGGPRRRDVDTGGRRRRPLLGRRGPARGRDRDGTDRIRTAARDRPYPTVRRKRLTSELNESGASRFAAWPTPGSITGSAPGMPACIDSTTVRGSAHRPTRAAISSDGRDPFQPA